MAVFIDIIRLLLRKWKLWVFFPLMAMALVFYLTRDLPRDYIASGTVNVNLNLKSGLSISGESVKQYEISLRFQNLIEMTRSLKTMEIVRLKLLKDYLQGKNEFFDLSKQPELQQKSEKYLTHIDSVMAENRLLDVRQKIDRPILAALKDNGFTSFALSSYLMVHRVGSSNLLRITLTTQNPFLSATLAELFMQTLIEQNKRHSKQSVRQNRQMFERLVAQAKKNLDEKIKKLETYKIDHSIINLGEHTKAIVNQLVNLEMKLAHMKESRAAQEEGMNRVKKTFEEGSPLPVNLQTNQQIIELSEEVRRLYREAQVNELGDSLAVQKPREINQKLEEKREQMAQLMATLVDDVPYDLATTRQDLVNRYVDFQLGLNMGDVQIPILENQIERLKEYARLFAPLESNIGTFDHDIHVAQESYLVLLNKLNLAMTMEKGTGDHEVEVLDNPLVPTNPQPSKRAFMILGAGIAVGVLIVGLLVALELLDSNISRLEDYEKASQLSLLAAVVNTGQYKSKKQAQLAEYIEMTAAQQFKTVRKALLKQEALRKGIVISSVYQQEGKHWTVRKIAEMLRKYGHKVLVIDADWSRTPEREEEIQTLDLTTIEELPTFAGDQLRLTEKAMAPLDYQPMEWWQSTMESLYETFNFVFVIAPPMSMSTDWQEWSEFTAGNIHLFRAGRMFKEVDKRCEEALLNQRKVHLWTVFNKLDIEKMEGYVGEVAKKRPWLRRVSKQFFQRDFKGISL